MRLQPRRPQPTQPCLHVWGLVLIVLIAGLLWPQLVARSHPTATPVDTNARIDDVRAAFDALALTPRELTCQPGDLAIPNGGHFQGVQQAMIDGKRFAIISGSSDSHSYLVPAAIEASTAQIMPLKRLLARPFKHAGGFQVLGDYLAVGIEDNDAKNSSKIWILEIAQLLVSGRPRPIIEIERRGEYKRSTAGAVGIARRHGRHLLLVATWDSATIDIYTSNGKPLHDPACKFRLRETWEAGKADRSSWSDRNYGAYQNINLAVDKMDRVFMVGFARTGADNIADIFEIKLEESAPTAKRFEKIGRRSFHCTSTDFRAGAGLAITDSGELLILSCAHRELTIEQFEPDRTN